MKLIIISLAGALLISLATILTPLGARHGSIPNPECTIDCGFSYADSFDVEYRGLPFGSVNRITKLVPDSNGLITGDKKSHETEVKYLAILTNFLIAGVLIYAVAWPVRHYANSRH